MKTKPSVLAPLLLSALILVLTPLPVKAAGVDVYIIYLGTDKSIKTELKRQLSDGLTVKTYNTNLLAMADYSGKQKAVAKISKAKLVVLIKDEVYMSLDSPKFAKSITVSGSTHADIERIRVALR